MADYFFEKETDLYHIAAVGEDRESAFVTIQSKTSGLSVFHFSALHSDRSADTEGLEWWVSFLREAERLEGDALSKHLLGFVPISRLDDLSIQGIEGYSAAKDPETGQSMLSLSSMLDTGEINSSYDILSAARKAKEVVDKMISDGRDYDEDRPLDSLSISLNDMERGLRNNPGTHIESATFHHALDRAERMIKKSGVLKADNISALEQSHLYKLMHSLHSSRLSSIRSGRREIELSSGHFLPSLEIGHPYHEAVKKMVMGRDCLVPDELLNTTGWFGSNNEENPSVYQPMGSLNASVREGGLETGFRGVKKGGAVHSLSHLIRCENPEEKRNLFQSLQAFDFHSGALDFHSYQDKLKLLKNGHPISELLWAETAANKLTDEDGTSLQRIKFGKKETRLMIHNLKAINDVIWHGKEGEIKTSYGETLVLSPYTREEMRLLSGKNGPLIDEIDPGLVSDRAVRALATETSQYAKATLTDKEGKEVFSGNIDLNASGRRSERDINDITMAFALMDLPPGVIKRPEHLYSLPTISANTSLRDSLVEGGLMLRDKQVKRMDAYNGPWKSIASLIDREIEKYPDIEGSYHLLSKSIDENKTLERYRHVSHISDMESIVSKVMNALKAHYLVEPQSRYSDFDELLQGDEESDCVIHIYGEEFPLSERDSKSLHGGLFYNAKLDLSEQAHKGFSSLKKSAAPDVPVAWEPALPPITLDVPGQSPVTIENLSSYTSINQEGSEMNHCLASYAERCMRGEYLAFSITQDGKSIATLGMEALGDDEAEFDQLQGYGNGAIDPVVNQVIMSQFVEPLEEDGVIMDEPLEVQTPDDSQTRLNRRQLLALQMDFEVSDDEKMSKCREYLINLFPSDKVMNMIGKEIARQYQFYEDMEIRGDMEGFFHFEKEALNRNIEKLRIDFGARREKECGISQ